MAKSVDHGLYGANEIVRVELPSGLAVDRHLSPLVGRPAISIGQESHTYFVVPKLGLSPADALVLAAEVVWTGWHSRDFEDHFTNSRGNRFQSVSSWNARSARIASSDLGGCSNGSWRANSIGLRCRHSSRLKPAWARFCLTVTRSSDGRRRSSLRELRTSL